MNEIATRVDPAEAFLLNRRDRQTASMETIDEAKKMLADAKNNNDYDAVYSKLAYQLKSSRARSYVRRMTAKIAPPRQRAEMAVKVARRFTMDTTTVLDNVLAVIKGNTEEQTP